MPEWCNGNMKSILINSIAKMERLSVFSLDEFLIQTPGDVIHKKKSINIRSFES